MADIGDHRQTGTRYRLDEAGGTWWELGWNQTLGTFYAHHREHRLDPAADHLVELVGTRLGEIGTVNRLADRISRPLPAAVADQLDADRAAFPFHPPRGIADVVDQVLALADADKSMETSPPADDTPGPSATSLEPARHPDGQAQAPGSPWPMRDVIATGYRHSGLDATLEQVTRPSLYPFLLLPDGNPGEGVEPHHASMAALRVIDDDRGHTGPAADIDLVRLSAADDHGSYAGHDIWLRWQPSTQTWEGTDDPRHHSVLRPGPHAPPESWTLDHEIVAVAAYEAHHVGPPEVDHPDDGLDP